MLHTDIPTRSEIERLVARRGAPSVSIYLPTTPISQEARTDRLELKNLAGAAVDQMRASGADKDDVAGIEEALGDLVDDNGFWDLQANSLAVFATPSGVTTFRLPNRIGSFVEVSDRFDVKHLLRATTFPQTAFVLALSQHSSRLLEITSDPAPREVHLADLPNGVADVVAKDAIADRAPVRRIQGAEGQKVRIRQYARQVDRALRPLFSGRSAPLILAATEPLNGIFRSVNSYPHLAGDTIPGSPEHTSDTDLVASARAILDEVHAAELRAVSQAFEDRVSQDRTATDVAEVARAATFGAVDTVLVDIDEAVPGSIDEESGAVTFAEAGDAVSYDVVDEIARRVLLSGGHVLAVRREDIPGAGSVAAILRYAL